MNGGQQHQELSPDKHVSKIQHDLYMFRFHQMEKIRANIGENYEKLSDMLPMIASGQMTIDAAQDAINYVFTDMDNGIYEFGMFAQAAAVALQMMKEQIQKLARENAELLEDLDDPYHAEHPKVLDLLKRIREAFEVQLEEMTGANFPALMQGAREFADEYLGPNALVMSVEGE